jgi:hypothetical protein
MATTQVRGNTQIIPGSILDAQIGAAAAIATTKLADGAKFIKNDGSVAMAAALNLGTNKIVNQVDPTNPQEGATKHYVDTQIASGVVASSATARVLSNAQIAQSGIPGNVDGITNLTAGQVICCNGQTAPAQNGLWVIASLAWTRLPAMSNWSQVPGLIVSIQEGTQYHDTLWLSVADASAGPIDTGTITFTEIPGPQDIIPGAGLTRTGQTLQVAPQDASLLATVGVPTAGGLKVNSAVVLLKGDYVIRETPSGTVNGVNAVFGLANQPATMQPPRNTETTEQVFVNGLLQEPGSTNDYTLSGQNITFVAGNIPQTGDRIRVSYLKGPATAGP